MMSHDFMAVILAAGHGKRMGCPLPKILHPLMGKPLISHVVDGLTPLGPKKIYLACRPDLVSDVQKTVAGHVDIFPAEPLGTGTPIQTLFKTLDPKGAPAFTLVMLGDVPGIPSQTLESALDKLANAPHAHGLVLAMEAVDSHHGYGRLITNGDHVQRIVEHRDATQEERQITLCNTGVMVFRTQALADLCQKLQPNPMNQEVYLTDIIEIFQNHQKIFLYDRVDATEAQGVNTQADLASLEAHHQQRKRHEMLAKGVRMVAPETVFFSHDTVLAPGVVIEPNVIFGPKVTLEENVLIRGFSHLEGCHIKAYAQIGPFARIRPRTTIEENGQVGNFVELKNTTLGPHSKARHLTYLGDSTIEERVNIGAGTITCNYDGYDKFTTHIGAHTFIGSNVSLIAPLTLGAGSLVGAGSIITQSIESDTLSLSRPEQKNIPGGAKTFRKARQKNQKKG